MTGVKSLILFAAAYTHKPEEERTICLHIAIVIIVNRIDKRTIGVIFICFILFLIYLVAFLFCFGNWKFEELKFREGKLILI